MGKSKVWVNGKLMKQHFGGFLPVIVDVSNMLKYGEDNVITVMADNSDDPSYPPGKAQDVLDLPMLVAFIEIAGLSRPTRYSLPMPTKKII